MKNTWLKSRPPADVSPFWWLRWIPALVISMLILYLLVVIGSVALVPLLASFALAYLLDPIVFFGEQRGLTRMWSSILAIILVTAAIAAFLTYVIPELWTESTKAGTKIVRLFTPENAARQRAWLKRYSPAFEQMAGEKIERFLSDPLTFYRENMAPVTATVDANGNVVASSGGVTFLSTLISSSLDLLLIPFFVFYILIDFGRWRASLEDLIPPRFREPFKRLFDESGRILQAYVRGQLLIAAIMAICYAIGFFFLGIPAWAGIALIAGLLNSIPYVGTALGLILAGGFTLAAGKGIWSLAAVLGVFIAVQCLEGYILTPRILGGRLNLHPMAVFLSLLIGGKLYGFTGIILAIPVIAVGKVFLKFLRELYQASHFYHAGGLHPSRMPSDKIEERLAEAANTILADQVSRDESEKNSLTSTDNLPVLVEKSV